MKKFFNSLAKTFSVVFSILFAALICNVRAGSNRKEHIIPIAMATDSNYVHTTVIAMTSMLENKNDDTYLDFHIMLSGDVGKYDRDRIQLLQNLYQKCSVKLVDMKDKFRNSYIKPSYITTPTYYRLSLPSLLSKYDKILYLDGDIMVRKDLWNMYNTDLKDNYVAGVRDFGLINYKNYAKRMGIRDLNKYVNAGVLIMNIKQMRKDNMEDKFNKFLPELKRRNLLLNDQDVLNATCYGKITILSPVYNAMQHFGFSYDNLPSLIDCYNMQEYKKSCVDPTIVHYTATHKPWKGHKVRFYNEWDKYRKIAEQKLYRNQIIPNGIYTISSALNNKKALDISAASKNDGANLQLWDSNFSNAQKFRINYIGEGLYEIKVICSDKCLDVEGAQRQCGTNVQQYRQNNTNAQKWFIKSAGNGYYYIISKCNGLYLDVNSAKTKNGTNIHVWNFNGSDAQKFKFTK